MNELQQKVFDYLTSGEGTRHDRKKALADLVSRCEFFEAGRKEAESKNQLQTWVEGYARGEFCRDGVERFVKAMGLPPDVITITLELNIEVSTDKLFMDSGSRYAMSDFAGRVKQAVVNAGLVNSIYDVWWTEAGQYPKSEFGHRNIHAVAGAHAEKFHVNPPRFKPDPMVLEMVEAAETWGGGWTAKSKVVAKWKMADWRAVVKALRVKKGDDTNPVITAPLIEAAVAAFKEKHG